MSGVQEESTGELLFDLPVLLANLLIDRQEHSKNL